MSELSGKIDAKHFSNPLKEIKVIVSNDLERVNKIILSIAESENSQLVPAVANYLHNLGGKRLRPILTLAFSRFTNIEGGNAVYLAASVELIHTATLLHDDVVDESDMRRGANTANKVWGNKPAILVGDYLFSHAFILMVNTKSLAALELLSSTSSIIAEAEVRQIEMINNINLSIDDYISLICSKTAVLFAAACKCGVIDQSVEIQDAAYNYGLNLGIVYQIMDDALDYFATDKRFGKSIGNDLKEKKVTLPLILLLIKQPHLRKLVQKIFEQNVVSSADVAEIVLQFHKHNIAKLCEEFAEKYVEFASKALKIMPNSKLQLRELLQLLLESLCNRAY